MNKQSAKLKISVIMVDGSFREQAHAIGAFARQTIPAAEYELLWVEYFGQVPQHVAQAAAPFENVRCITLGRGGHYHSSYCFNAGIRAARGELIVIPDGDVIVEETFLEKLWRDHHRNDRLVQYCHRYNEPEQAHRGNVSLEHLRGVCRLNNPTNHGACLTVRRKWLRCINGYDQHPIFATGFHANDRDVYTRLRNLGLDVRWSPTLRLYHPWHAMTEVVSQHYTPQLELIHWRGCTLATLPFEGLNPNRNVEVPEQYQALAAWLREQSDGNRPPLARRVQRKVSKWFPSFGQTGKPVREAA